MKDEKRNKIIKARVSEEEKKLIEEKAKYYGYRNVSNYIMDAVIYEKVTQVDEFEIRQLSNSIWRNMINQTDIRILIGKKLKYNSWKKINRNKHKNKNASELYKNLKKF